MFLVFQICAERIFSERIPDFHFLFSLTSWLVNLCWNCIFESDSKWRTESGWLVKGTVLIYTFSGQFEAIEYYINCLFPCMYSGYGIWNIGSCSSHPYLSLNPGNVKFLLATRSRISSTCFYVRRYCTFFFFLSFPTRVEDWCIENVTDDLMGPTPFPKSKSSLTWNHFDFHLNYQFVMSFGPPIGNSIPGDGSV